MTARSYFHFGVLVNDLTAAIDRYSRVLGLTFTDPTIAHVDALEEIGGATSPADVLVSYSRQGPPYYELIEAHDAGIYGRQHGEGFHHVGIWEPGCETRRRALVEEHGLEEEATQYAADGRIIVTYFLPSGLHGVRLELVDEARRADMERWISGGDWVD
jgi:catechol 2,3-dioxygenase-like lactoylglutathione lyase family enzyme